MKQKDYRADDVVLAVEVVSEESQIRDRKRKPQLYAEAGTPHFWRVEEVNDQAAVYVYELDSTAATYTLAGVHRGQLVLEQPFPIDIDLTAIARM